MRLGQLRPWRCRSFRLKINCGGSCGRSCLATSPIPWSLGGAVSIFMRLQPVRSLISGDPAIENLFHLLGKKLEAPDIILSQGQKSGLDGCAFEDLNGSV